MRTVVLFFSLIIATAANRASAQYHQLWIPDTLVGTTFDLTIRDTFKQILPGNQTITEAINGNFWGPTMIWNKWDVVHPVIHNQLSDTTTVHWHGIHLPAIMDGGPHQTIPPYTTWTPYWQVVNNAGTYWYHPHLDKETMSQLTAGIGGLIIIRDSTEAALNLPRTYGVDDIPLVFSDRKFDSANQFIVEMFGDSIMTNGVLHAQYTVPAQMVRFRILCGSTGRSYEFGFSDNRNFQIIASDGGLLDSPVTVNRLLINEAERYEIVADFAGQEGTSVDLKAFNSELNAVNFGEDTVAGPPSALDHVNFGLLHINVGLPTINPVTYIPHQLTTNTYYDTSLVDFTRQITISDSEAILLPGDSVLGLWGFILNHRLFDLNYVDYSIPLNHTEIWELNSSSFITHPFHIHDIEFHILSIDGMPPPAYEAGWKDVVGVPANKIVRFITKFDDYSDSLHPYMFHCHIARHEDEGMMGQFVVGSSPAGIMNVKQNGKMKLYPNPAKSLLSFEMSENIVIRHATVINTTGQIMKQFDDLNTPKATLDLSSLNNGLYFLRLTDTDGGTYIKSYLMQ